MHFVSSQSDLECNQLFFFIRTNLRERKMQWKGQLFFNIRLIENKSPNVKFSFFLFWQFRSTYQGEYINQQESTEKMSLLCHNLT